MVGFNLKDRHHRPRHARGFKQESDPRTLECCGAHDRLQMSSGARHSRTRPAIDPAVGRRGQRLDDFLGRHVSENFLRAP